MNFRTPYNETPKDREVFATVNSGEILVEESHSDETDINIIMAKYNQTGLLPQVNIEALTGDFSDVMDFREAQDRMRAADEAFAAIPADLRKRFDNDPQRFINWVLDDANLDETRKLGYRTGPEIVPDKPEKEENNVNP